MAKPIQAEMNKDLSIPVARATLWSIVFGLPLACLLIFLYAWRWGAVLTLSNATPAAFGYFILFFFTALILGSITHELIHAFSWAYFSHKPLRAIKFGVQWKTLTPYAHCREPMEVQAYRLGGIMPLLVLGILPTLIGIGTGNGWVMFFGILFTMAAGGDLLVLWLIRDVRPGQLVQDHPTQVGCYLIGTQTEK